MAKNKYIKLIFETNINIKRFILTLFVVAIVFELLSRLIEREIMGTIYLEKNLKGFFRPAEIREQMYWLWFVTDMVWSFLFTYIFVKAYEGRGVVEGVKYGTIGGLMYYLVMAYQIHVLEPLPYYVIVQWFLYGMAKCVIVGMAAALVYKPKPPDYFYNL